MAVQSGLRVQEALLQPCSCRRVSPHVHRRSCPLLPVRKLQQVYQETVVRPPCRNRSRTAVSVLAMNTETPVEEKQAAVIVVTTLGQGLSQKL